LVLDGNGNHFACGRNESGQLGTGDTIQKEKFTQVNLPVKFISLSAGYQDHSLGIAEDGSLWSWGSNDFGQLGQGERVSNLTQPTQILNTHSFVQMLEVNFHWLLIPMKTFGLSEIVLLAVWDWEKEWKIDSGQLELKICPTSNLSLLVLDLESFWIILDHCGHSDTMEMAS
jgi:hypothetical protein